MAAVHDALPLRQCTDKITGDDPDGSACALAEMGRCGAPCEGRISPGRVRRDRRRWSATRWPATRGR